MYLGILKTFYCTLELRPALLSITSVTRLGEFSPNGQFFNFGQFFKKNYRSGPTLLATVFQSIDYVPIKFDREQVGLFLSHFLNLNPFLYFRTKNGLGYFLSHI
jgi:hypothetical protein